MSTPGPFAKSDKFLENEFSRLLNKGRKHLVLEEVLRFQAKGATLPVDLCHLGILWVLDRYAIFIFRFLPSVGITPSPLTHSFKYLNLFCIFMQRS
jgi:hypothetical protein